jgi:hypothetical protein
MYYTGVNPLKFFIDPCAIKFENFDYVVQEFVGLKIMLNYLQDVSRSGLSIEILYPKYLTPDDYKHLHISILPEESIVYHEEPPEAKRKLSNIAKFLETRRLEYSKLLKKYTAEEIIDLLKTGNIFEVRDYNYLYVEKGLNILDLAETLGSHYFITSNSIILKEKKNIEALSQIIILSLEEMLKEVELFLIGNGIFISRTMPVMGMNVAVFYPATDPKFHRYERLWSNLTTIKNDNRANNYFRVAIFHRYCFMLYARDQIDFQMRQNQIIKKSFEDFSYRHMASYHLNSFYIMLWGLLDNLAWVFNFIYDLGFDDSKRKDRKNCTFQSKIYLNKILEYAPMLFRLIKNPDTEKWLKDLSIKRHTVAHREPIYLSQIVDEKDMSLLADNIHTTMNEGKRVFFEVIDGFHYDLDKCIGFLDSLCDIYLPQ